MEELDLTSEDVDYNGKDPFVYSYNCHEAMITFAYALNKTIAGKCPTVNY